MTTTAGPGATGGSAPPDTPDPVVLVTGAAGGIGAATARRFAAAGAAHLALVDRDGDGARRVADRITAAGTPATAHQLDVTDEAAVADLVDGLVATHGRLDVAFNNAGVSDVPCSVSELELERWNRMLAVNLTSVFVCLKHELRHMRAAGRGVVVNTSSGAGLVPAPGLPHYTAAKHGVVGLTRAAAREVAREGVRVNAVLPGATDTPMIRGFIGDDPDLEALVARSNVGGELLDPDDIADVVVWLASPAARRVNGQAIVVDGGGICH